MDCKFTEYYQRRILSGEDVSIAWVGFTQTILPSSYYNYSFNEYLPVANETSRIEFTLARNVEGYIYLLDKDKRIMARLDHSGKYMSGTKLSLSISDLKPLTAKSPGTVPRFPLRTKNVTAANNFDITKEYADKSIVDNKTDTEKGDNWRRLVENIFGFNTNWHSITGTTTITEFSDKPRLMKFDPQTNKPNPYPSEARQYREYHGLTAWLYNPYTGKPRDPRDIGTDVEGKLL